MLISIKYGNFSFISESGYPVPKVTIDRSNNRTASQEYLGSRQIINLEGIIYTHKMVAQYSNSTAGSSSSSGLLDKAINLKKHLLSGSSSEPKLFLMLAGAQPVISGSGYIESINFDTSNNRAVDKIDYSISIELYDNQTGTKTANKNKIYHVSSVQDSIEIESNLDQLYMLDSRNSPNSAIFYPTYTISRTLGAVGNRSVSGSLIEAIKWVNDRQTEFPFTGVIDTGRFPLYNYTRSLDINESNGSINIRDTFLSKNGDPWIDSYDVSTSISDDFTRDIKINGSIEGLHKLDNLDFLTRPFPMAQTSGQQLLNPLLSGSININNMKYTNALSGYSLITGIMYDRALMFDNQCKNLIPNTLQFSTNFPNYRSASLHPIPLSITEGLSPNIAKIEYGYTFNSRPLSIISGALSETFSITDTGPIPRISNIPVIGRRLGPVVYFYTASSGAGERTVSYEGVFNSPTGLKKFKIDNNILNSIENYLLNFKPQLPFTGLITGNNNSINLNENRIRKSITWQYTKCNNG
jgi:hypothetical protein